MQDKFDQFYAKWNGKPCEVNDPSNKDQCMDLAYAWMDWLDIPRDAIRHLYAKDIFKAPNDITLRYFEVRPNTAMFIPQVGDVAVFDIGTAGHVSIATGKGNTSNFESFDQNFATTIDKCGLITHSYNGFLGVLRVRVNQTLEITNDTVIPQVKDDQGVPMPVFKINSTISDLTNNLKSCEQSTDARINEAVETTRASLMATCTQQKADIQKDYANRLRIANNKYEELQQKQVENYSATELLRLGIIKLLKFQ